MFWPWDLWASPKLNLIQFRLFENVMPPFVMMVLVASLATLVVTQGVLPVAALAVALQMAAAVEEKMLALVVLL